MSTLAICIVQVHLDGKLRMFTTSRQEDGVESEQVPHVSTIFFFTPIPSGFRDFQ